MVIKKRKEDRNSDGACAACYCGAYFPVDGAFYSDAAMYGDGAGGCGGCGAGGQPGGAPLDGGGGAFCGLSRCGKGAGQVPGPGGYGKLSYAIG